MNICVLNRICWSLSTMSCYRKKMRPPMPRKLTRLYLLQAFVVIIFVGVASSFLILPPNKVVRGDGTVVKVDVSSKLNTELLGLVKLLKDWRMLGEFAL